MTRLPERVFVGMVACRGRMETQFRHNSLLGEGAFGKIIHGLRIQLGYDIIISGVLLIIKKNPTLSKKSNFHLCMLSIPI